jgi:membrane-associated protease RseP (regulator of RpoE activity)
MARSKGRRAGSRKKLRSLVLFLVGGKLLVGAEAFAPAASVVAGSRRHRAVGRLEALPDGGLALQAASLLTLVGVVTVHEFGHYSAAWAQGIRVKSFNVGFGPKLLSFRGRQKLREGVAEVEYCLRAIPLGGYVSFPNVAGDEPDADREEQESEGLRCEMVEEDDPDLLQNRPLGQRALVIAAGVVANFMLTWSLMFGLVANYGITRPEFSPGAVITDITDFSGPAAKSGLKEKDVLLDIGGQSLGTGDGSIDKAIRTIRASNGEAMPVHLLRGGNVLTRFVQAESYSEGAPYTIGVRLGANIDKVNRVQASNPIQAATLATEETTKITQFTASALVRALSLRDFGGMSGPIGVVRQGASLAQQDGPQALLQFAAIISVNLAVINSLPIPGLDGGQVRRRSCLYVEVC